MVQKRVIGRVLLAGAGMLAVLTACQRLERRQDPLAVTSTGDAALHAIQSDRLKGVMNELSGLNFERLPQELQQNGRRRAEHLEKAGALAAAMAEAAGKIPIALEGTELSQEEQQVFRALAKRLGEQASRLSDQVRADEGSAVDATMREINTTCVSCHTLFRNAPEL